MGNANELDNQSLVATGFKRRKDHGGPQSSQTQRAEHRWVARGCSMGAEYQPGMVKSSGDNGSDSCRTR